MSALHVPARDVPVPSSISPEAQAVLSTRPLSMEGSIDLVDGEFWGRNPHEELAWLRANAPVWRDPVNAVWGVATYDLVKHVSSRPSCSAVPAGSGRTTTPFRT